MAKRPVVSKDLFEVTLGDGTKRQKEIAFAQSPSSTYRWGVMIPSEMGCGEVRPEGIWTKAQDDAIFAAESLRPQGGYAIARYQPQRG